jgi:hypothetical protein
LDFGQNNRPPLKKTKNTETKEAASLTIHE